MHPAAHHGVCQGGGWRGPSTLRLCGRPEPTDRLSGQPQVTLRIPMSAVSCPPEAGARCLPPWDTAARPLSASLLVKTHGEATCCLLPALSWKVHPCPWCPDAVPVPLSPHRVFPLRSLRLKLSCDFAVHPTCYTALPRAHGRRREGAGEERKVEKKRPSTASALFPVQGDCVALCDILGGATCLGLSSLPRSIPRT